MNALQWKAEKGHHPVDTNQESQGCRHMKIESNSTSEVNLTLIENIAQNREVERKSSQTVDKVDAGMDDIYKSLTVLADDILNKLDELLEGQLPEGVRSLDPAEHTPEKTASRIVDGVLGLMSAYERQNPELKGEELLNSFMKTIRGGIQQGYGEAMSSLGDIGALDFPGVEDGISQTMDLVDKKLKSFEEGYLKSLKEPVEDTEPKESQDIGKAKKLSIDEQV